MFLDNDMFCILPQNTTTVDFKLKKNSAEFN